MNEHQFCACHAVQGLIKSNPIVCPSLAHVDLEIACDVLARGNGRL